MNSTKHPLAANEHGSNMVHALRHPARFLSIFGLVLSAALLGNAGTAGAADPLLCFDGTTDTANGQTGGVTYGGHCTLNSSGTGVNDNDEDNDEEHDETSDKDSVEHETKSADHETKSAATKSVEKSGATLDNSVVVGSGDYSGVSFAASSLSGNLLSEVSDLSFTYTGTPTAGSPRISLPIDTNADGTTEFYAFIGALYCNNGAGLVDPLHDTTCTIFYTGGPVAGEANWAAFVAAQPTWRVAGSVPFIIADDAGLWTVNNVHLGAAVAVAAGKKDECKDGRWANMTRADGSSFKNQGDCIQEVASGPHRKDKDNYVNTGK